MGCDSDWGDRKPTPHEQIESNVDDPLVRELALALFGGFNMGAYLDGTNRESALRVARAIEALISDRAQ